MNKEVDEYILNLGEAIDMADAKKTDVAVDKVEIVKGAYKDMKRIATGSGLTIKQKLHKPFSSSGAVIARGFEINIEDTKAFVEIAKDAQCFDIYAEIDGHVVMTFSYEGLAKRG